MFLRGDPGDGLYVVARGSVGISVVSPAGNEVVLAILWPPHSFGELAVIDGGPRAATATARETSTLVLVPRRVMQDLMSRSPAVTVAAMNSMATPWYARVDEQATDLVLLVLPGRVEKLLAATAQAAPVPLVVERVIPCASACRSPTELAHQVGGSRQQVNRILMALEATGAIKREGHRIVGDPPGVAGPGRLVVTRDRTLD